VLKIKGRQSAGIRPSGFLESPRNNMPIASTTQTVVVFNLKTADAN
jgi:hypothetical protein